MLFLLLLVAACAASNGQSFPRCKKAGWPECAAFTERPGFSPVTGVCVVCEVLHGDNASSSPFPFLTGVNNFAIRGYPFHVLSATILAPLEQSEVYSLGLLDSKIADVKNNTFSGFSRLLKISLDSNRLTSIKQTWFTGLEALLVLVLSNNNIKEIQPRSFVHLTKLQLLDLENNMLQVVDPAWLFGLEDNTVNNNDVSAVNINPGRSCGDLDSSLSMIPIQPPVVVLATDGSLADKLDTNVNTLEQCRQVWEYDGGITVVLIENSVLRLVSMATGNATSEGVAMSGKHTKVFFTVPLDQSQTHTTETSYRIGINHSSSVIHYSETTEKGDTSSKPRDYPTLGVVSSTPGPDLEVAQAPDHALITSVVVSAVIVLVMSFLAVLTWKACAAKLDAEDERQARMHTFGQSPLGLPSPAC
ncbi:hypothetical protein Bbelb_332170 [Branchiostoma belcheri]|nr:hypothetical protein Bbelb_332170 [Branchiostoma belcheri]